MSKLREKAFCTKTRAQEREKVESEIESERLSEKSKAESELLRKQWLEIGGTE